MLNTTTNNTFFQFDPAGMPDVITGASQVTSLNAAQAAALAAGESSAASAGKGLAAVLAMLVFGSASYKTNPWELAKSARGRALKEAFGTLPHVRAKVGKGIALADFQAFFDSAVNAAMSATNSKGNAILGAVKTAPKTGAKTATVTKGETVEAIEPDGETDLRAQQIHTMHHISALAEMEGIMRDAARIESTIRQQAMLADAIAERIKRDKRARVTARALKLRETVRDQARRIAHLEAMISAMSETAPKAAAKRGTSKPVSGAKLEAVTN